MEIRSYQPEDHLALISLWAAIFRDHPLHNEPARAIEAKIKVDRLLFVAIDGKELIGSVMAGYDGHRGWLYTAAVAPRVRRRHVGSKLVQHAISHLRALGCVKVNLQVRSNNSSVVAFYKTLGFKVEDRISMGRLLELPDA